MKAAYFFSGFDAETGFSGEIAQNLHRDLTRRSLLLVIASTPASHDKNDRYFQGIVLWFKKAGILFDEYRLLDDRTDKEQATACIASASAIFLMGGDTLAQIAYIKDQGYMQPMKKAKCVVMGMSAGAINKAKTSLCTEDSLTPETVMYEGIGVADITIEPHFDLQCKELVAELKQLSRQHAIYGLCDGSAIITRGDTVLFLGLIYEIRDGEIKQVTC